MQGAIYSERAPLTPDPCPHRAVAGVGSGMPAGVLTSYTDGPDFAPCAAPSAVRGPPLEEHLAQNTLWPETHKLYGHGNDVFCTAASHDGRYAASACVAKSAAAAEVWVWAIDSWKSVAQLQVNQCGGEARWLSPPLHQSLNRRWASMVDLG